MSDLCLHFSTPWSAAAKTVSIPLHIEDDFRVAFRKKHVSAGANLEARPIPGRAYSIEGAPLLHPVFDFWIEFRKLIDVLEDEYRIGDGDLCLLDHDSYSNHDTHSKEQWNALYDAMGNDPFYSKSENNPLIWTSILNANEISGVVLNVTEIVIERIGHGHETANVI